MCSHVSIHKCAEYSSFICTFLGDQPSKFSLFGKEDAGLGVWCISKAFHGLRITLNDLVALQGLIQAFKQIKTVEQTHVECSPSQWDAVRPSSD